MTTGMLRELLRQQPFKPFRLVMSSGEASRLHEPAEVARSPVCAELLVAPAAVRRLASLADAKP